MVKDMLWLVAGLGATAYLLNLGIGIGEISPDNLPIVGNIDEAIATVILLEAYKRNK